MGGYLLSGFWEFLWGSMENRADLSLENGVSLEMNFLDIYENENSKEREETNRRKEGFSLCDHTKGASAKRGAFYSEWKFRTRLRHVQVFHPETGFNNDTQSACQSELQ